MPARLARLPTALPMIASLLLLAACSSTGEMTVDAVNHLAAPSSGYSTYRLVSAHPDMVTGDFRFRDVASHINKALSGKGLIEAPQEAEADMVIEVDFGIEEPRTKKNKITEAIFADVRTSERVSSAYVTDRRTGATLPVQIPASGPPQPQVVGYRERVITETTCEKFIRITARDNPAGQGGRPPHEIWSVFVKNEGESENLKKCLPRMISAAVASINPGNIFEHRVAPGEDLAAIAARYQITGAQIRSANQGVNVDRLRPGQKIKIPARAAPATTPTASI